MLYVSCTFQTEMCTKAVMSIGDYRSAARSRIRESAQGSQIKRNVCKFWIARGPPFPAFPLDFERGRKR